MSLITSSFETEEEKPILNDISTFSCTLLDEEDILKQLTLPWVTTGCLLVAF